MKRTAESSLNVHDPDCYPFSRGACCRFADDFKKRDGKAFDEFVANLNGKRERLERRKPFKQAVARKKAKQKQKTAKKERGIRSDSSIDRLNLDTALVTRLVQHKISTVGQILEMPHAELMKILRFADQFNDLKKAFARFGKELREE